MAVPNPLKRLRSQLGLSQQEVATKVGVSQPNYQRWESGAAPIPADKLKKLARVLHSTTDVLSGVTRYAAASLSIISGADGYWGEAAIHFASGSEPIVVSISEQERDRLEKEFGDERSEFFEVSGLCNEHYVIRRRGISEAYLSDEAADRFGAAEAEEANEYPLFEMIPLVDDRLWDVLSNFNQESESLEDDFPLEDIVQALSYFMTRSEMSEYLSVLVDESTPAKSSEIITSAMNEISRQMGISTAGVDETTGREERDSCKTFLLSRATGTVIRLGKGVERRFVVHGSDDMSLAYGILTGLALGERAMISFSVEDGQVGFFRSETIDFVRFPKHYLGRALDGMDLNIYGTAGVEEED